MSQGNLQKSLLVFSFFPPLDWVRSYLTCCSLHLQNTMFHKAGVKWSCCLFKTLWSEYHSANKANGKHFRTFKLSHTSVNDEQFVFAMIAQFSGYRNKDYRPVASRYQQIWHQNTIRAVTPGLFHCSTLMKNLKSNWISQSWLFPAVETEFYLPQHLPSTDTLKTGNTNKT